MTLVKVCGLRELAHALAAADAGADLLGMVFVPAARRLVATEQARQMVAALHESRGRGVSAECPRVVGLFADQSLAEVRETARAVGLDAVQLCGQEGPDYWPEVGLPLLKVVHVPQVGTGGTGREALLATVERRVEEVSRAGHLAVLDAASEGQKGGAGRAFDWSLAAALSARGHRFLMAGGLTPDNVGEAIATARPYGVDVSSGVEANGVKDPARVRAFVAAARAAERAYAGR